MVSPSGSRLSTLDSRHLRGGRELRLRPQAALWKGERGASAPLIFASQVVIGGLTPPARRKAHSIFFAARILLRQVPIGILETVSPKATGGAAGG